MIASLKIMGSCKASLVVFLCIFSLMILHGTSTEFAVGDTKGWGVPPPKDAQVYNEWARNNRFKVNDTLQFKYKKDSVMVVTEEEYKKCQSSQPLFFSNNGDTTFSLDRPGLFYFISGVAGHCSRGQKMVIKVLDVENPPSGGDGDQSGGGSDDKDKKSGATRLLVGGVTNFPSFMLMMIVGFLVVMA